MPRRIETTVALVLAVSACGGGAGTSGRPTVARKPAPPVGRDVRVATSNARRLAVSWSSGLAGSPGGMASDREGAVVSVDNDSVAALDANGEERWSARVPGAGLGWPVLGDGLVVVPTLRDEHGPGGCVALDRDTGARAWAYEEPASEGVAVARSPKFVICALGNGVVVAIDRVTGTRRWRAALADQTHGVAVSIAERSALAVDDATGIVAMTATVGSSSSVAMLDLDTGANRGAFDFTDYGRPSAPVWTAPGFLAVALSRPAMVCVMDLRKRHFGSCVAVAAPLGFDPATIPLAARGLVVVAARDGSVSAVDLPGKKVRWAVRTPRPIVSTRLAEVAGIVMFSDWTRVPWAVHLADGEALELPEPDGWVISTVADAGGGFELAKRNMDGGWLERWAPV